MTWYDLIPIAESGPFALITLIMISLTIMGLSIIIMSMMSWSIKGKERREDLELIRTSGASSSSKKSTDAEEALKDSEAKYRAIVQNVSDLITYVDTRGRIVDVNNMLGEMLGYNREGVIGKNFFSLGIIQIKELPKIIKLFKDSIISKEAMKSIEMTLVHRNGSHVHVEIGTSLIRENGHVKYVVNIIRDVTERKIAAEKLAESEKRFKDLATLLPQTIFEVNLSGTLTYANKCALRSFGYSREDLERGVNTLQLFAPEDRDRIFGNMRKLMAGKKIGDNEYMAMRKDGTRFPCMIYSNPVLKGMKPAGLRGVVIDLTDQKNVENELIDERKRAELYLDLLSHDIGNLHQGIYSGLQIAEMRKEDPSTHRDALRTSEELVKRSLKLVKNVLLLSQLKTREVSLSPIELNSTIESSRDQICDLFPYRKIEINIDQPDDRILVAGEPIIEELFSNLIHNAVKFQVGDNSRVDIFIEEIAEERVVVVSVSDYGIGIPDQMKPILFDRFVKSGKQSQTGIGLSLVKELVDRYDGEITVGDRVPGDYRQGACFNVTLPVVRE